MQALYYLSSKNRFLLQKMAKKMKKKINSFELNEKQAKRIVIT